MKKIKAPKLKAVRLRKNEPLNKPGQKFFPTDLSLDKYYLVIGEMEDTKHYVLMDPSNGFIVRGIWEAWRLELVPKEEL